MSTASDPIESQGLQLGTLAYQGVPTQGSVIVYSNLHGRWGRVPMPEVQPLRRGERWLHLLKGLRPVRWVMGGFASVLLCFAAVLHGLSPSEPGMDAHARVCKPRHPPSALLPCQVPANAAPTWG